MVAIWMHPPYLLVYLPVLQVDEPRAGCRDVALLVGGGDAPHALQIRQLEIGVGSSGLSGSDASGTKSASETGYGPIWNMI